MKNEVFGDALRDINKWVNERPNRDIDVSALVEVLNHYAVQEALFKEVQRRLQDYNDSIRKREAKLIQDNLLLTSKLRSLEVQNALYKADAERIWDMMPELKDTDSHYELHEAVQEKIKVRDTVWLACYETGCIVCADEKSAVSFGPSSAATPFTIRQATVFKSEEGK